MNKIVIISGVFHPEPIVSARILHTAFDKLTELDKHVDVICPYPSRPIGFSFSSSSIKHDANVHRIKSYVAKSASFREKIRESFSFAFFSTYKLSKMKNVKLVYNAGWFLPSRLVVALFCVYHIRLCWIKVRCCINQL